jgi:hypothetical protein
MSLAPYSYRPATPPEMATVDRLHGNIHHSRRTSNSSFYDTRSSPDTAITTPSRSPVLRQHGPTLLPRIRPQDATAAPLSAGGPKRIHRRMVSTSHVTKSFAPYPTSRPSVQRSVTEPLECSALISPVSASSPSFAIRNDTTCNLSVSAPATQAKEAVARQHCRSASASSIEEEMLSGYSYPTYSQLSGYCTSADQHQPVRTPASSGYVSFQPPTQSIETHDFAFPPAYPTPVEMSFGSRNSMTPPPSVDLTVNGCLLSYLTEPTQPFNLVRQLTISPGRGMNNYFWWDVRNLRSWEAFSLDTISSIPGLLDLLNFGVDTSLFPQGPSASSTVTPASEGELANLASKIYFPNVNAAIQLSQGTTSLSLYQPPSANRSAGDPYFLANYPCDADRTISGLPRGRLVGIVKSFDRWNTGMRQESPARKVDYLSGLSHLQKCMRDHSCRYGFILTEIELVCVRAGCDDKGQPYFGYLEVSDAIATNNAALPSSISSETGTPEPAETPLTVMLALYYLLMLTKSTPLPGQPGSFMDVGGPGTLTRQRTWSGTDVDAAARGKDGKDKWIPEPQMGEKRDAKRNRGWVWPHDPWHKREGSGAGKRGSRAGP